MSTNTAFDSVTDEIFSAVTDSYTCISIESFGTNYKKESKLKRDERREQIKLTEKETSEKPWSLGLFNAEMTFRHEDYVSRGRYVQRNNLETSDKLSAPMMFLQGNCRFFYSLPNFYQRNFFFKYDLKNIGSCHTSIFYQ